MASLFEEVRSNQLKSVVLVMLFCVVVVLLGSFFGFYYQSPLGGVVLAWVFSIVYFLIMYHAGDSLILGMSGAREAKKSEFPHLVNSVEGLAVAAGIPAPSCFVIDDSALNAFATGRDPSHASICVTTGLLNKLNRQELEGVIAHEMSHIKNYDIRVMLLATVLVGVITLMGDFFMRSLWFSRNDRHSNNAVFLIIGIALAILAPLIGFLLQMAISRQREYLADASGAILTRYPPGLASALKKIAKDPDPLVDKANRATAHLFISTPFRKKHGWVTGMFSTHPRIEDRIARLERM